MTTMKIVYDKNIVDPSKVDIKCIAIAPPPVFAADISIMDKYKKHIQIYVNQYDLVPRISLYSFAKFSKAATRIDQEFGRGFSNCG